MNHRVLVADDAPKVGQAIAQLLLETGVLEVLGPVLNGLDAWSCFQLHRPAAAVLDLNMPGRSGVELLRAIHALADSCFIIILTNADEPSLREQCLHAGAAHFLNKSRDFERVPGLLVGHFSAQATGLSERS
jgi:DNA-binding NarL/FixJ family response regulator